MPGPDDHLLETPDPDLLHEITGVTPDVSGKHAILPDPDSVRSTQRIGLGEVGGGIAVLTWPGELAGQARRLYNGERAPRLLAAAARAGWGVELRPHLAFWHSSPSERLYLHASRELTAEEYVRRWAGEDAHEIGGRRDPATVREKLWPWLLDRGYATAPDAELLEPFLDQVRVREVDVHLRPGLAVVRRWDREDLDALRHSERLAADIREAVDRILFAIGDPPLPASSG